MKTEKVYSKIHDKNIKNNLVDSPIWKDSTHISDVGDASGFWEYTIKFDGLKPIQVTKIKCIE